MRSMRLWPLVLTLFSCHSQDSQLDFINENLRINGNITLIRNTIPTADRLPNLPVNPAYFVIMNDVKDDGKSALVAYPVNCEDSQADNVLGAFGLSKSTASKTSFGINDLKTRFQADQQPVLNCSAVKTSADQRQVSAVFRLQNVEGQTPRQNPSYYLKFNGFPDQIYQVGCLDILNYFAADSGETVNFAEAAVPLTDPQILQYLDQDVPATELGTEVKGDKGIRRLSCRDTAMALPQPSALASRLGPPNYGGDSRLLHVETVDDSYYVYAWRDGSRRVECPGASETEMLQAFNFAVADTAVSAQPTDPAVLAADQLEPLRCVNPLFPATLSLGFRTVDVVPEQHAFKSSRESSELFTFGCPQAEKFFVGESISKEAMIPVAWQSFDYLLSHPNLSKPTQNVDRVHISCANAAPAPKREDIQNTFVRVFGVATYPEKIESYEENMIASQIRSEQDVVNYFINGMAFSAGEVELITRRAFQRVKGRDPTEAEKTLIADLILNKRKILPHYSELVTLLAYSYNESTPTTSNWRCISCSIDPTTLSAEAVELAFLEVFGLPANEPWIKQEMEVIKSQIQSYSVKDIVNYFVKGMASSENEAKLITERAFQIALFRAAKPEEVVLFQNLIVKEKKLRPNFVEVAAYLRSVPLPKETVLQDGKTYRFILGSSGHCLDIPNSSLEIGIIPQQWPCNGTGAQDFVVQSVGGGYYTLMNKTSGKCLDVDHSQTLDGIQVWQWNCHGGANQRFFAERAEGGAIRLKLDNSGLCLEGNEGTADTGALMRQAVCRPGQRSQLWSAYLKPESAAALEDGHSYAFVSKASAKCLDIGGVSKDELQQWTCNGTNPQNFRAKKDRDGSYALININSNKCLNVTGSSTTAGTKLQQTECLDGRPSQRFLAEKTADGNLVLKAAHTKQCVDLQTSTVDNGIRVQQSVCKADVKSQVWIPFELPILR